MAAGGNPVSGKWKPGNFQNFYESSERKSKEEGTWPAQLTCCSPECVKASEFFNSEKIRYQCYQKPFCSSQIQYRVVIHFNASLYYYVKCARGNKTNFSLSRCSVCCVLFWSRMESPVLHDQDSSSCLIHHQQSFESLGICPPDDHPLAFRNVCFLKSLSVSHQLIFAFRNVIFKKNRYTVLDQLLTPCFWKRDFFKKKYLSVPHQLITPMLSEMWF